MSKKIDYNRCKDVLFSSKTPEQLNSVVKYINNFYRKYKLTESSSEFKYFDTIIPLIKLKIKKNKKKFMTNESDDLDWIKNNEPGFDTELTFKGFEYWIDISKLSETQKHSVIEYIFSKIPNDTGYNSKEIIKSMYNGLLVHCANEDNDYRPKKNVICLLKETFENDLMKDVFTLYVDGMDIIYFLYNNQGFSEDIEESMDWGEKDNYSNSDETFTNDKTWSNDVNWEINKEKSYWKQGSTGGGDVNEEEDLLDDDEFYWLKHVGEHPNYKGHPQGIVLLRNHQEIDRFCDIIDEYNGGRINNIREWLHTGLEDKRNELESMSVEDNWDYGEALLSVSFFVEKINPGKLTLGFWSYDVTKDELSIKAWLDGDDTFNKDYQIYNSLNQVEGIFKNYQNPELD